MTTLADIAGAIERGGVLFCTVVTRSHLRYAHALRQMLRRHHPHDPFCVLVVDALDGDPLPEEAVFDCPLVRLQAFLTPKIQDMTIYYAAYELCGNIKPYFLQYLFGATAAEKIVYLDSDLFVTGRLDAAVEALDTHEITAAPHTLTPIPDDGQEPSDLTIAANGAYNTGLMGFRRTAAVRDTLAWMADRVHRRGFNAFSRGMFCEQRFFNLGVSLHHDRFQPIRQPGYNVGYWNLHERIITRREGAYFANGERVTYFHMSGFELTGRERLSVYDERYKLADHPQAGILAVLSREYEGLIAGVPFAPAAGYRFDVHNGIRLTPELRMHYHRKGTFDGLMSLDDALRAGRRLRDAGSHGEAERLYLGILAQAPRNTEAIYGCAVSAAALGRTTQARQLLHQVLAIDPAHADAARRLAGLALPPAVPEPVAPPVEHQHWLCGWHVRSDVPLPELPAWRGTPAADGVAIRLGPIPERIADATAIGPLLQVGRDGTGLLTAEGVGRILVREGRHVVVDTRKEPGAPEVRHHLLGIVVAMLAHQRGLLPLHAAAVRVDGGVVLIAGPSGTGKSTLGAALMKRGHALLADDVSVIDAAAPDRPVLWPSVPRLRLQADSLGAAGIPLAGLAVDPVRQDKFHVHGLDHFHAGPLPLRAVYLLRRARPGEESGVERLHGGDAVKAAFADIFGSRIPELLGRVPDQVRALARLAETVPVHRLTRTDDIGRLKALTAIVESATAGR
ncbi:tetratricopeptide repeat protein [Azospirillum sp. A39]|uniref:tetratricopeptide repeat protein n=1 Tax=Azospirillum sp. A39 TaxID=3462279 RepID=UPI004045EC14